MDAGRATSVSLMRTVQVLEGLYPLDYAEEWDHPGLIVGDPTWPVSHIYCAVDPRPDIVGEAIDQGADLLITHHPLFFRPVHEVSGLGFRGSVVNDLVRARCGLWVGHTNADSAVRGVAQAAADRFGLQGSSPLVPLPMSPHDLQAGSDGTQTGQVGMGRVGTLPAPMRLDDFARLVARVLPHTELGIQVAGHPGDMISKVAVLPGSGDSMFDQVRACGADVYVTSDLRHHPATDAYQQALYEAKIDASWQPDQEQARPALINTPHSAIESLWFDYARTDIPGAVEAATGFRPTISVSRTRTDPWDFVIR